MELILILPGGRLPLLSTRPTVTFPAKEIIRIYKGISCYILEDSKNLDANMRILENFDCKKGYYTYRTLLLPRRFALADHTPPIFEATASGTRK